MSARRLSRRIARLALVLAAVFGGVSMAGSAQTAGGPTEINSTALATQQIDVIWV